VLSSFQLDALEEARDVAPELPRGLLLEDDWKGDVASWIKEARRLGCAAIHPKHSMVDRAAATAVKRDGFTLAVYTVNDGARARDLVAMGVDTVITDKPEAILAALAA
jgi:glycerophosphoryl diester phosphodiesterase